MFKVILWDIDNTLINFDLDEKFTLKKLFEQKYKLGELTEDMLKDYIEINNGYWKKLEKGLISKKECLVNRFIDFLNKYSKDSSIAENFNDDYINSLGENPVPIEGALEVLEKLKGKVMHCAVTNGTRVCIRKKIKLSGIDKYFEHVFISEEMGFAKPKKEFFEEIFKKIGNFSKDEILIVGDSLTSDMQGGINSGIKTCWLNRKGDKNSSNMKIDFEIYKLEDVLKIVNK